MCNSVVKIFKIILKRDHKIKITFSFFFSLFLFFNVFHFSLGKIVTGGNLFPLQFFVLFLFHFHLLFLSLFLLPSILPSIWDSHETNRALSLLPFFVSFLVSFFLLPGMLSGLFWISFIPFFLPCVTDMKKQSSLCFILSVGSPMESIERSLCQIRESSWIRESSLYFRSERTSSELCFLGHLSVKPRSSFYNNFQKPKVCLAS